MNPFLNFSRDINKDTIEVQERILIVCEGEKTEPNYFEKFEAFGLDVKVLGTGKNTESLVNLASKYVNDYDEVWCVYDKDSFEAQQFNNAYSTAVKKGMNVAYSNESFELWYLLHFDFHNTQIGRVAYIKKLDKKFREIFKKDYQKNSEDTYELLKSRQETALRNADNLERIQRVSGVTPSNQSPVTLVHHLVRKLNKSSRENRWNRKRYIQGTIESISKKEIVVNSEMDGYGPDNFKQGDKIHIKFDSEIENYINIDNLINKGITVEYSEMNNEFEIDMVYPNNAEVNGDKIFKY